MHFRAHLTYFPRTGIVAVTGHTDMLTLPSGFAFKQFMEKYIPSFQQMQQAMKRTWRGGVDVYTRF
jgi:hypothetical protein